MAITPPTASDMPTPSLKGNSKQNPTEMYRGILKRKREHDDAYCTVHNGPVSTLCSEKCTMMRKRSAVTADDEEASQESTEVSTSGWTRPRGLEPRNSPHPAKKAAFSPFQQDDETHATHDSRRMANEESASIEPSRLVPAQTVAPRSSEPARHGRAPSVAPMRPTSPASSRMYQPPIATAHGHARMAPHRTINQSPLSRERAQTVAPVSPDNVHTAADALLYLQTQTDSQANGRSSPTTEGAGSMSHAPSSSPLNSNTAVHHTQAPMAPTAVMAPPAPTRSSRPSTSTQLPAAMQLPVQSVPHSSPSLNSRTPSPPKSPRLLAAEASIVQLTQRYFATEQKLTQMHAEATQRLTHMHNALQASRARATHFETQCTALRASDAARKDGGGAELGSDEEETNEALLGPRPKPKVKKSVAETKMRSVRQWRRIIEGKDRVIEGLEREIEGLRGEGRGTGDGEGIEGVQGLGGEGQQGRAVVVVSDGEGA
ncbi:hypothetical protein LTR95_006462 [Oleoguttula sp. CCFEE 5521]